MSTPRESQPDRPHIATLATGTNRLALTIRSVAKGLQQYAIPTLNHNGDALFRQINRLLHHRDAGLCSVIRQRCKARQEPLVVSCPTSPGSGWAAAPAS